MDIEFFCSQNMMPVAIPFKTILSFDEAGVGFLPMSFLDEASKIQVGKKELNVFVAKTACKRSCRIRQIREELKQLQLHNKFQTFENILREVAKLSKEINDHLKIAKAWEKRRREVEKRYRKYCQERCDLLKQGEPAVFKQYDKRSSYDVTVTKIRTNY